MRIRLAVAANCCAIMALAGGVTMAAAQSRAVASNPADPSIAVPAVKHDSAFSGYQAFREEQRKDWRQANQEVADNPGMGSMQGMAGHSMPGMDAKSAAAGHDMGSMPGMPPKAGSAPKAQAGAAGHDMGSMQGMPGMVSKAGSAPKVHAGAAGHDHNASAMQGMPGMDKQAPNKPAGKDGHGAMAMAMPQPAPGQAGNARSGPLTGTGVVRGVDKANGKVRLTHQPIAAMGWPKMTLFFRLKDSSLADRVKDGDRVEFSLEKSASGYVISSIQKGAASHDTKQMK